MNQQTHSRSGFIDYLRGIGMILVILGHAIQFGSGAAYAQDGLFFENIVFRIIYSFHMPFFLMISGYLAYDSIQKYSFPGLVRSRIRSLLVPIITWGILQYLIQCFLHETPLTPHSILSCGRFCIENNWFLWAALYCTLIVGLIQDTQRFLRHKRHSEEDTMSNTISTARRKNKWKGDRTDRQFTPYAAVITVYAILFIVMLITPDTSRTALYKFVFPFFAAAYFIAGSCRSRRTTPDDSDTDHGKKTAAPRVSKPGVLLVTAALYLLLLHFFHTDSYIYISRFSILGKENPWKQIGIDLYRTAIGFAGSLLCIMIAAKIYKLSEPRPASDRRSRAVSSGLSSGSSNAGYAVVTRRWIERLGRNSLGIYLISGILFEDVIAKLWVNHAHSFLLNLAETAVVLLFSDFVTDRIAAVPLLNRIFLGGRH